MQFTELEMETETRSGKEETLHIWFMYIFTRSPVYFFIRIGMLFWFARILFLYSLRTTTREFVFVNLSMFTCSWNRVESISKVKKNFFFLPLFACIVTILFMSETNSTIGYRPFTFRPRVSRFTSISLSLSIPLNYSPLDLKMQAIHSLFIFTSHLLFLHHLLNDCIVFIFVHSYHLSQ